MATPRRTRQRARRGSGSITRRGQRFFARVDLGLDANGERIRRNRSFDTQREAQVWIDQQRSHAEGLILPVADQRIDEYRGLLVGEPVDRGGAVPTPPP